MHLKIKLPWRRTRSLILKDMSQAQLTGKEPIVEYSVKSKITFPVPLRTTGASYHYPIPVLCKQLQSTSVFAYLADFADFTDGAFVLAMVL